MPSSPYFPWCHVACPLHPTSLGDTWHALLTVLPSVPRAMRSSPFFSECHVSGALYFTCAEAMDRFNFLRNMKPPPLTSAQLTITMHTKALPIAVLLYGIMAVVFFSHLATDDAASAMDNDQRTSIISIGVLSPPPPPPPPPMPPPPVPPEAASGEVDNAIQPFSRDSMISINASICVVALVACITGCWALRGRTRIWRPHVQVCDLLISRHTSHLPRPSLTSITRIWRPHVQAAMPKRVRGLVEANLAGGGGAAVRSRNRSPSRTDYTPPLTAALLTIGSGACISHDLPTRCPIPRLL